MTDRPDEWGLGSFSATNVAAASGGVSATQAAPSNLAAHYLVTGIQYSSDAACVVTVESPSGTVLWRKRHAAAIATSENFAQSPLKAATGQAVLVKVSASTSNAEANVQGYTVE